MGFTLAIGKRKKEPTWVGGGSGKVSSGSPRESKQNKREKGI